MTLPGKDFKKKKKLLYKNYLAEPLILMINYREGCLSWSCPQWCSMCKQHYEPQPQSHPMVSCKFAKAFLSSFNWHTVLPRDPNLLSYTIGGHPYKSKTFGLGEFYKSHLLEFMA